MLVCQQLMLDLYFFFSYWGFCLVGWLVWFGWLSSTLERWNDEQCFFSTKAPPCIFNNYACFSSTLQSSRNSANKRGIQQKGRGLRRRRTPWLGSATKVPSSSGWVWQVLVVDYQYSFSPSRVLAEHTASEQNISFPRLPVAS